jgi:predicted nucleotidyltransferase
MLPVNLRKIISDCARDYGVKTVWLFGSALEEQSQAGDIDLAVEGLAPEQFFDFYGKLYFELPKPVDLVDLSQDPPIAAIIREKGIRIYEQ